MHFTSAKQFHDEALVIAAQQNRPLTALPLFRAAVRLEPREAFYLNDLGVTELRIGDFKRAQKRFKAALQLDKFNEVLLIVILYTCKPCFFK